MYYFNFNNDCILYPDSLKYYYFNHNKDNGHNIYF